MSWWMWLGIVVGLVACGIKIGAWWNRVEADLKARALEERKERDRKEQEAARRVVTKADAVIRAIDAQLEKGRALMRGEETARQRERSSRQARAMHRLDWLARPHQARPRAGPLDATPTVFPPPMGNDVSGASATDIREHINRDPSEVQAEVRAAGEARERQNPSWFGDDTMHISYDMPPYSERYLTERSRVSYLNMVRQQIEDHRHNSRGNMLRKFMEHEMGLMLVLTEAMGEAIIESEDEEQAGEQTVGEALAS